MVAAAQAPDEAPRGASALLPAEVAWEVDLPARPAAGGALDAIRVYVAVASGEVVALGRASGRRAWGIQLDSTAAPLIHADVLYVATSEGLHALDPGTGAERWRTPLAPAAGPLLGTGSLVIVPVLPAGLVAIGTDDGQPVWRWIPGEAPDAGQGPVAPDHADGAGPPGVGPAMTADDDQVYVASPDGQLTAIGRADGSIRWSQALDGVPGTPLVDGDRVFVGTAAGTFVSFDTRTGRSRWRWSLGASVVGAAADGDRVYVAALDNLLRAFNHGNGHQRWRQALPTRPLWPPRLVHGELLVAGVDPVMHTFRISDGAPVSSYTVDVLAEGAPLVDTGGVADVHLVLVLRDGRVIGLRRAAAAVP